MSAALPELESVSPDKSVKKQEKENILYYSLSLYKLIQFTQTNVVLLTDAWRDDPLVVVGIDTNIVTFQVKGILAIFDVFQFILV